MTDSGFDKGVPKRQRLLHHLGIAAGLLGLILWFWAGRALGFLDWATRLAPSDHAGAGLMIGIMVLMLPALLIYRQYNRWLEARLGVSGRYYEDDYYRDSSQTDRSDDS